MQMIDERRKSYRVKMALPCKLRLAAQLSVPGRIVDASNSGVQLIVAQPVATGTTVQLFLGSAAHLDSGPDVQIGGRVVWCRASHSSEFAVGLLFNEKCISALRSIIEFLATHPVDEEGRKCRDLAIRGTHPVRFRVEDGQYLEGSTKSVTDTEVRLVSPHFMDPSCPIEGWLLVTNREDPVLFLGELRACVSLSDTSYEWTIQLDHIVG